MAQRHNGVNYTLDKSRFRDEAAFFWEGERARGGEGRIENFVYLYISLL
jgi:hypothetical protein